DVQGHQRSISIPYSLTMRSALRMLRIVNSELESACRNRFYSHLSIPILGLSSRRPEHFEVPLSAAPRLDDVGGDDVHQDFGKRAVFGIVLQVIGLVVPDE